jgi:hypothetical protein
MKRILTLAFLLSIPALAAAQEIVSDCDNGNDWNFVSEEWSTYCDDDVEKVRASLTFQICFNPHFDGMHGELEAREGEGCIASGQCGDRRWNTGEVVPVGNDSYRWTWDGFERACLSGTTALRYGVVFFWLTGEDGEPRYSYIDFNCGGNPFVIVDNSDCAPTHVATSTWGGIKALYRTNGETP